MNPIVAKTFFFVSDVSFLPRNFKQIITILVQSDLWTAD